MYFFISYKTLPQVCLHLNLVCLRIYSMWMVAVSCSNMYENLNCGVTHARRSVNGMLAPECVVF
jgi:hypothetical protein